MIQKNYITIGLIILLLGYNMAASYAEPVQWYEDPQTGQVFTRPAPGRVAIDVASSKQQTQKVKPEPTKLILMGRVLTRAVAGQKDSIYSNGHSDYNAVDVHFRQIRLGAKYKGDSWWGGVVDIRLENLLNSGYTTTSTTTVPGADGKDYVVVRNVKLNDSPGAVQAANVWLKAPFMHSKFTMGQTKIPFLREDLASALDLIFPERAMGGAVIQHWDIGLLLDTHPLELIDSKYTHYMKFSAGFFNGKGSSLEGRGRQRVLTETRNGTEPMLISPLLAWRLELNPFDGILKKGKIADWHEGREIFQRGLKLSLGIAGVHIKEVKNRDALNLRTQGISKIYLIDKQTTATGGDYSYGSFNGYDFSEGATNPFRPSFGLNAHSYDFTMSWAGWYSNGQYTYYTGSAAATDIKNYAITFGYTFPLFDKYWLMPAVRYDVLQGDFDNNDRIDPYEHFKSYWVGGSFIKTNNRLKLMLYYNILQDKLKRDYVFRNYKDANNNVVYFQLQMSFSHGVRLVTEENQ